METIERIYRLLAKRYHPDNPDSGDAEKFDTISRAYRVISSPEERAVYDAGYEKIKARKWKILSATPANNNSGASEDNRIRNAILSILYIDRRNNPSESSVGVWQLEKLLGWPEKALEFHVWYLKQKGLIERTDSGGYAITVSGIDVVEENELVLGKDRLLTEKGDIQESSSKSVDQDVDLKVVNK